MIIDAHTHILPDRVRGDVAGVIAADPWFADCHAKHGRMASAETLVAALDEHGIDKGICFSWPFANASLCAEGNDYVATAQKRHPDRIIGFGIVQPLDAGAVAEVERCARLGLRGIGELNADAQGFDLLDQAALQPVIEASRRCGLVWNLHCSEPVGHAYAGKGKTTPDVLVGFVERNPDLTLVCSHLGGGLPLYAHLPEVREICQKLYFDTAAQPFVYAASIYRAVIDAIGIDRILFGSDHPLLDLPRYRDQMARAGLSATELAGILGDNAKRLLEPA